MFRQPGFPVAASSLPAWNIFFAREPEPDLDLDDLGDSDKPSPLGASSEQPSLEDPEEPEKSSSRRPLVLALLAVLVAAGAYLAMEPGSLMDMLGQDATRTPAAPAAPAAPPATAGSPNAQVAKPTPAPAPAEPSMPPVATAPGPSPMPQPTTAAPMGPFPSTALQPPTSETSPAATRPSPLPNSLAPLFSEGQLVSVVPDPTLPAAAVALSSTPEKNKPGPMVSPSDTLTVMDGELRNNAWVYAVRTQQGTVGWIGEQQLRAATP